MIHCTVVPTVAQYSCVTVCAVAFICYHRHHRMLVIGVVEVEYWTRRKSNIFHCMGTLTATAKLAT